MAKKTVAKKPKTLTWPNGKKVAVSLTIMFETWPDDSAPNYSVQTTHLKKGTVDHAAKAWSTYGGRVGVWRLMRTLERLGIPATFFVNARCTEVYPDAVKQIAKSGFDPVVKNVAETGDYFKSEVAIWGKMVNAIGFSN